MPIASARLRQDLRRHLRRLDDDLRQRAQQAPEPVPVQMVLEPSSNTGRSP